MISLKALKTIFALILSSIILISCNGKLPGGDARKNPDDPKLELKKTLKKEEGLGLMIAWANL